MATIYRIIEHKDGPDQKESLDRSIGSARGQRNAHYAALCGISEVYRGTAKPTVLEPKPYNFEPGTLFARKILIWFEGDWWLTDNPEQEFGRPSHYIELPELRVPQIEKGA